MFSKDVVAELARQKQSNLCHYKYTCSLNAYMRNPLFLVIFSVVVFFAAAEGRIAGFTLAETVTGQEGKEPGGEFADSCGSLQQSGSSMDSSGFEVWGGPDWSGDFPPANAFDKDVSTLWAGESDTAEWELCCRFVEPRHIGSLNIEWYGDYTAEVTVYTLFDGFEQEETGHLDITGDYLCPQGCTFQRNQVKEGREASPKGGNGSRRLQPALAESYQTGDAAGNFKDSLVLDRQVECIYLRMKNARRDFPVIKELKLSFGRPPEIVSFSIEPQVIPVPSILNVVSVQGGPGYDDSYYSPGRTIDNDASTSWVGDCGMSVWFLVYDFGCLKPVLKMEVEFHDSDYRPQDCLVCVSADGEQYEEIGFLKDGCILIDSPARYVKLQMSGNIPAGIPAVTRVAFTEGKALSVCCRIDDEDLERMFLKLGGKEYPLHNEGEVNVQRTHVIARDEVPKQSRDCFTYARNDVLIEYLQGEESWAADIALDPGIIPGEQTLTIGAYDREGNFSRAEAEFFLLPPPGASGGPGYDDSLHPTGALYVPENAFDLDSSTLWAGEEGKEEWTLYYKFGASVTLNGLFIDFYDPYYIPEEILIYTSKDGLNWDFARRYLPPDTLNLEGVEVNYLKIEMKNLFPEDPLPVIKDIVITSF